MLIVMRADAGAASIRAVEDAVAALGFRPVTVGGPSRVAVCVTGNRGPVPGDFVASMPGVLEVIRVSKPYKLVSREVRPESTRVRVGDAVIGGGRPVLIAGPCSVETESRTLEIARRVKENGATLFRGGAFKPRTSPYSFQGLGVEGLHTLARVRAETGLPVVSEVLEPEAVDVVAEHVDVLQVGARNMQNYPLLRRLGGCGRPVLLKRGLAATLEEWLMAAEYLLDAGNDQVILCERGIRTVAGHSRNTLDVAAIPEVRRCSHLPIIADPSHGVGDRRRVRALARAALAAGAHGLMIEVHVNPDSAYSDASQTIGVEEFAGISADLEVLTKLAELRFEAGIGGATEPRSSQCATDSA